MYSLALAASCSAAAIRSTSPYYSDANPEADLRSDCTGQQRQGAETSERKSQPERDPDPQPFQHFTRVQHSGDARGGRYPIRKQHPAEHRGSAGNDDSPGQVPIGPHSSRPVRKPRGLLWQHMPAGAIRIAAPAACRCALDHSLATYRIGNLRIPAENQRPGREGGALYAAFCSASNRIAAVGQNIVRRSAMHANGPAKRRRSGRLKSMSDLDQKLIRITHVGHVREQLRRRRAHRRTAVASRRGHRRRRDPTADPSRSDSESATPDCWR